MQTAVNTTIILNSFKEVEKSKQIDFYRALKKYCRDKGADCKNCCLRLYCYTPPCERTDEMMVQVIQYLSEHTDRDPPTRSDHYTVCERPCVLDLNMTGALGSDSSQ